MQQRKPLKYLKTTYSTFKNMCNILQYWRVLQIKEWGLHNVIPVVGCLETNISTKETWYLTEIHNKIEARHHRKIYFMQEIENHNNSMWLCTILQKPCTDSPVVAWTDSAAWSDNNFKLQFHQRMVWLCRDNKSNPDKKFALDLSFSWNWRGHSLV